jgi:ClpP class serine protease
LLIHRQESISLLGIPISRFINIEDSEQILRAIRLTPANVPIDLILHTPGGLVLATEQIARALLRHGAKVTVFIPHYAMSGGTMLAMAADEIVMDENAVLGPVDPQLGNVAAASILKVLEAKPPEKMDDQTLITADLARKAINQVQRFVRALLEDSNPRQKVDPANIDKNYRSPHHRPGYPRLPDRGGGGNRHGSARDRGLTPRDLRPDGSLSSADDGPTNGAVHSAAVPESAAADRARSSPVGSS